MAEFNLQPSIVPSDSYTKPNDFELVSLSLESDSGGAVDLRPMYENVSFSENIHATSIIGNVLIKDTVDLLNTFPITGHEKLKIVFRTPGIGSELVEMNFRVVEVTDRVRSSNERSEVYRLKILSDVGFVDKSLKLSKSVKGKISDIASSVYSESFGKELDTQETLNEQKYVIPRWSPFKFLEWLSSRAIPAKKSDETNYLFFETTNGHRFITLSELCSQEPLLAYVQMPPNIRFERGGPREINREFLNPREVKFLKTNQKLKEHMQGAFSSVLYQHDLKTKKWQQKVFNYNDDTNVRYITDNRVTQNKSIYTESPNVNFNLITKQTGLMGEDFPNVQNHEEWFQRTLSSKSLVDTIKMRLGTAGNSLLRAGTVIEIFVPKTGSIKGSDPEWYDKNASGKYLITTLRHIITPDGYTNSILLSKNSYEEPIADKSEFMGTGSSSSDSILKRN